MNAWSASAAGTTDRSRSPRDVTRTLCPRLIDTGLRTRHCSPLMRAYPSGSRSSRATPTLPISASSPVTIGRRRALSATAATKPTNNALTTANVAIKPNGTPKPGHLGVDQHHRAYREGDDAARAERAEGGKEQLGDHEQQTEQDERQAGVVDRQHLQREQSDERGTPRRPRREARGPDSRTRRTSRRPRSSSRISATLGSVMIARNCVRQSVSTVTSADAGGRERAFATGGRDFASVELGQ